MSAKRRGKALNMSKVAGDIAKALEAAKDTGEAYEQEKLERQLRIKPISPPDEGNADDDTHDDEPDEAKGEPPRRR